MGALFGAAMLAAGAAAASVPDVVGYGARSSALNGLGSADDRGYESAWLNPAGLADAKKMRFTVGWVQGGSSLRLDGADRPTEATSGAVIGSAVPLPFTGALQDRAALSVSLYFPRKVINHALAPFPDVARLALLESRTQVVSVLGALGVRITPRLSLGGGINALATLLGQIKLQPDAGNHIVSTVDQKLDWAISPLVGARYTASDALQLALVFRGAVKSQYDLRITSNLGTLLPIGVPVLRVAGTSQYDPAQLHGEAAWRLSPALVASAGATYKRWSDFPLPTENATARTPPQPETGFHDTVVPRIGIEWTAPWGSRTFTARGGYRFEWSPSPSDAPTLVDANRHVVSGGLGLTLPVAQGALQIDAFAQWHELAGHARASGRYLAAGATVGIDL